MKVQATSWFKPFQTKRLSSRKLVQLGTAWMIHLDKGRWVSIPIGFISDGASVPNTAWPVLFSNALQLLVTGVGHDYSVRRGALIHSSRRSEPFTKKTATEFAIAIAEFSKVNRWDRFWIARALNLTVPTYWQKKEIMWTPRD